MSEAITDSAATVAELTSNLFSGLLAADVRARFTDVRSSPGCGQIRVMGPDGRLYEAVVRPVEGESQ